jgi:hypothetical protein
MKQFTKGQHVYDPRFKFGVVAEIDLNKKRPIKVSFYSEIMEYCLDGKEEDWHFCPMLYHAKVTIG